VKISAQYDYAKNFSGGISYVEIRGKEYKWLLINSKGETIKSFDAETMKQLSHESGITINSFSRPDTIANGMIIVKFNISKNGKWLNLYGALDKEGNLAIRPLYHKLGPFTNGIAQASVLVDQEDIDFKTMDRNYSATFTYLDAGLIDKKGKWVQPTKKKMEYRSGSTGIGYLTITDSSWNRLTQAEKDAANTRAELAEKQRHAEASEKLESQVRQKVSSAQGQGYLIEKTK
jgi:hypothetical protein